MRLEDFYYDLPEHFIAQEPLEKRDRSKLMLLDKRNGSITHDIFFNLPAHLKPGDILVVNESKVTRCRLFGIKSGTGAKIECFVLKKIKGRQYLVLLKPSKRLDPGDIVSIGRYSFRVDEKFEYGKASVTFNADLKEIINECGEIPLPPYIKNTGIDRDRYQTVFARKEGSAAAPTAGFHFTPELISNLQDSGIMFARLKLDIGLDTFRPISTEKIEEHAIHSEYYSISANEAGRINAARKAGGRVIAVGTTSTRVLETVSDDKGYIAASRGSTSLYIYPGYRFKAVDALITNFHLPYSSLLVMVSAFAGMENIKRAYESAKENGYRFFSFGDAMFIY